MKKILQKNNFQVIFWTIILITLWQLASVVIKNSEYLFPSFSKVIERLVTDIIHNELLLKAANSIFLVFEGLIISIILAIVIAVICNKIKFIHNLFSFLCTIFIPLPSIALLPLIIIWFGIDRRAILVLVCISVFWMILVQILSSIKQIPRIYIESAKNMELNVYDYFKLIVIPCIVADLISTMRIAWGRSWRSVISAEIIFGAIGSTGGLGYYLNFNRQYGRTDGVLASILLIIICSMFIEKFIFKNIEKHTIEKLGYNEK